MSSTAWIFALALAVWNVVALGLWLASSRWRLVLGPPAGFRERIVAGGKHALARLAGLLHELRQRLPRKPRPAGEPLAGWIDEVERDERTRRPPRPVEADAEQDPGSESWWRAWAASGGELPQAAVSCRKGDPAPSLGGPVR